MQRKSLHLAIVVGLTIATVTSLSTASHARGRAVVKALFSAYSAVVGRANPATAAGFVKERAAYRALNELIPQAKAGKLDHVINFEAYLTDRANKRETDELRLLANKIFSRSDSISDSEVLSLMETKTSLLSSGVSGGAFFKDVTVNTTADRAELESEIGVSSGYV